jgi:hypothetical protein
MHYYGPNRNTTFEELFNRLTALNLAANPPKTLISTVREFIQEARRSNITLRVSEANSVPDGGQAGLSNTLGAALWTLVTALEFAQAGASGINYHWGGGGSPGGPDTAPAYVGVLTGFRSGTQQPYPLVRVPYYGYVLFARAFGNNGPGVFLNFSSDAVVSECRELFFTYAILVPHAGMVSVVAVSANPNITCDVTATLPGVATAAATLQLLVGHPPGDMSTYEGVTLAGQTYQGQGACRVRHARARCHGLHAAAVARVRARCPPPDVALLPPVRVSAHALCARVPPPALRARAQRMAACAAPSCRSASSRSSGTSAPPAGRLQCRQRQQHCCRSR